MSLVQILVLAAVAVLAYFAGGFAGRSVLRQDIREEKRRGLRGSASVASLFLGRHGSGPDNRLVVDGVDLAKALRIRSVTVTARPRELTSAQLDVLPGSVFANPGLVKLPEDALRFLARSSGFDLVKLPSGRTGMAEKTASRQWYSPDWQNAGKTHDWRNHVSAEVRAAWDSFTTEQREALFRQAVDLADCEQWE